MTGRLPGIGSDHSQHRVNEIAGIPRWMSMLGVTATILPNSADPPVLIIASAIRAVAIRSIPGSVPHSTARRANSTWSLDRPGIPVHHPAHPERFCHARRHHLLPGPA